MPQLSAAVVGLAPPPSSAGPRDPAVTRVAVALGCTCAAVATGLAALVLAGWVTHEPALTRAGAGGQPVKFWTAAAILTLGLGRLTGYAGTRARSLSRGLCALAALLALVLAGDLLFGLGHGFDELLVDDPTGNSLPAPNTVAALLLIAAAGVLPRRMGGSVQVLAVAGGAVSFTALLGHISQTSELSGFVGATRMALATSVALTLLALATLLTAADHGPMAVVLSSGRRGAMLRRLLPLAIIGPPALNAAGALAAHAGWFAPAVADWLTLMVLTGLLAAVVAWQADVAEQAGRVELAAGRAARMLQQIADRTPTPMFVRDLNGAYLLSNAAHQAALGRAAVRGRTTSELVADLSRRQVARDDAEVLEQGHAIEYEETITTAAGAHTFLSMRFPVTDEADRIIAVGGMVTDVTSLKQSEQRVQQQSDEFERRVAERTAQLENRTAQLEQANGELQAFSYSVSHDLRAPLRAIDGFSKMVMKGDGERLSDQGRADLGRVRAATGRMGELIDELLKLSRLSRRPMAIGPVDLSALAREVADELLAGEPDSARTTVVVAPGLHDRADTPLMRTVLVNLIGNAVKFSAKAEHPRVEIGVELGADGSHEYFVRDNGVGFDMRHAEKLFTPFERLHSPGEFPGSGVGLATVQRIIRRHGGRVWALSSPGAGAAFSFTLDPTSDTTKPPEEVPQWNGP